MLAIHERLLAEHGGAPGIRDEGLVESALSAPRNLFAYGRADLFDLAARHARGLLRNHPFVDGNKRVALTVTGVFLERNGFRFGAAEPDAVVAIMALAERRMTEKRFAGWLRDSSRPLRRGRAPRS